MNDEVTDTLLDDDTIAHLEADLIERGGITFAVSFPVVDETCR